MKTSHIRSDEDQLLRAPSMCELLGISKATLWRWVSDDQEFPKPLKISEKTRAWRLAEVRAWMNSRARA